MAWLVRDTEVLAPVEVAVTRRARRQGLLGRDGIEGALLLRPARSVHTVGMRFAIDVAHCRVAGDTLEVLRVATMHPGRVGMPIWRAGAVLEAAAGALGAWGVQAGDRLDIRPEVAPA